MAKKLSVPFSSRRFRRSTDVQVFESFSHNCKKECRAVATKQSLVPNVWLNLTRKLLRDFTVQRILKVLYNPQRSRLFLFAKVSLGVTIT